MKRGKSNLRVNKNHKTNKWAIEGRKNKIWLLVNDENKNPLLFDLKYDACGYLEAFIEWITENKRVRGK